MCCAAGVDLPDFGCVRHAQVSHYSPVGCVNVSHVDPSEQVEAFKDKFLHRVLDEIQVIKRELAAQLPYKPATKGVSVGFNGQGKPALIVTLEKAQLLSWVPPFEEFRGLPVIWKMEGDFNAL